MADEVDLAAIHEERHTEICLQNIVNRTKEQPEFGDNGEKICTECGIVIPEKRAAIDFVVRCIECQEEEDNRGRLYS